MRILYLANFDDIHSAKWAQYFIDHGHDCLKFHVQQFSVKKLFELRDAIGQWKPDILHAHYAGAWGLMGALTGFHPFVVTIHGSEVLLTKGWKRRLVRRVLRKADIVTTDGFHVYDKIVDDYWDLCPVKIRKVNFGVDIEKFKPIENSHIRVVYRSGPDSLYDLETMEEAISLIRKDRRYPVFQEIKDIAPEKMPFFIGGASIYVSTALSDAGLASTTAEAMACGLPVVISDVADNRKWATEDQQLFKPGDAKELAEKISFFLRNPEERKRYGNFNRAEIVAKNNYYVEMAKMESIYKGGLR